MSCPFCEEKKFINSSVIGKGNNVPMRLMLGFQSDKGDGIFFDDEDGAYIGFDNSSNEYSFQYVKINFCPMCGRRLDK